MEKTRIRYSQEFKRSAVIEAMQGKKPLEILLSSGFDLSKVLKNDKKYASKLIHKWKKELLKSGTDKFLNVFNENTIKNKLLNLADDSEKDLIEENIKNKIRMGKSNYQKLNLKLKQIINTKY